MRAALAVLLLLLTSVAAADPQPMTSGGQVAPTTSTEIAIAREDLAIDVGFEEMEVDATLILENRGEAKALDVGFPCDVKPGPLVTGLGCQTRLDVSIDGRPVTQRLVKTGATTRNWVWPMRFARGQSVRLEVHYLSPMHNDRYERGVDGMGSFYYRLRTGASWAGRIGELNMVVTVPSEGLVNVEPAGYVRTRGTLTWHLTDFEPESDLVVDFGVYYASLYVAIVGGDRPYADFVRARDADDFSARRMTSLAQRWRAQADAIYRSLILLDEAERRQVGLPPPVEKAARACIQESARALEAEAVRARQP